MTGRIAGRLVPWAALALGAGLSCSVDNSDRPGTSPDEMVAVSRLMVTFDRVTAEGDRAGLAALFADDAVLMEPGEPAFVGRRAILDWYDRLSADFHVLLAHEPLEIDAAGPYVIHRGDVSGTLVSRDSGRDSAEVDRKYLFVLRRQEDGSLVIWRAMYNSKRPRPG